MTTDAAALLADGRTLLKAGRHRDALGVAATLRNLEPARPEYLLFAGEVAFARGDFEGCRIIAEDARQRFPDVPDGALLACRALLAQGEIGAARDLAVSLADAEFANDAQVEILTTVLNGCMEPGLAYGPCRRAVERRPDSAAAQRRLALTCRLAGRLDEAFAAADSAVRLDPHDYEMHGLRSELRRATAEDNRVDELARLLERGCRSAIGAARVACSLGKECEDLGKFDDAFSYYEAGARFKRQTIRYDVADDEAIVESLRNTFSTTAITESPPGHDSHEPLFILGLPRTGSTLLERILSSHSRIFAAGELQHFSAALMAQLRATPGLPANRLALARTSLAVDPAAIGSDYLRRTRPFTGHTRHFIDKQPLNYLTLGLIARALPNGTIVHVRRIPLDACFANFKFLFNEAYAWSYTLEEIGRYYVAYRRLMAHWQQVCPRRIVHVDYEALVDDLEGETRRLLDVIGLEWQDACLRFDRNAAAAMTGSAVQVRQGLYSSSVNAWRHYDRQLAPLVATLEAANIDPYRY